MQKFGFQQPTNQVGRLDYSRVYWKWVDDVANMVTKKYPDVYFTALAYREVIEPPPFKLNKNIVPEICFELVAMDDPEVKAKRLKLLDGWKSRAANLSFWDYSYGLGSYLFPRIYFKSHSEKLELLYKYNARSIFVECSALLPFEGPKHYLMAKKLYDINADPEKIVMDWIVAAVGEKSAPYLREYYGFWENYWNSPDIKKTGWYGSRFGTYLQLGEKTTHTCALKKGDMKKLRGLMEKVVANTVTPEQKRRAEILMKLFEFSENAAAALFSEVVQPDGSIRNAADAAEILRAVPDALKAYKKLLANPFAKYHGSLANVEGAQLSSIGRAALFLKEPSVRAEVEKLAKDPTLPNLLRAQFKISLGAKPVNLVANGSFEKASPMPKVLWNEGGAYRSAKKASDGDFALRVPNCSYAWDIKAECGKTYLFMFDATIKSTSIEGVLDYQLSPSVGTRPVAHVNYKGNRLNGGKWTTFSGVCKVSPVKWSKAPPDTLRCLVWLRKFEKEDEIYIDNVKIYCLDDLK